VKDAGIPMMNVDRKAFFNFLRARDLTSAAAIEDNRGMIVAWLRRNR
jgi:hypothetical protein